MNAHIDPLEVVKDRLAERGCHGRGANWQCPAHPDRNPSLSVGRGRKLAVVLRCHAGCTIEAILAALGLTKQDQYWPADRIQAAEPRPNLAHLEEQYRRGELIPEPVELGELPAGHTPDMWRIAEDVRLILGLNAAAGERRPAPYGCGFAADRMGWPNGRMRANRVIRALIEAGVLDRPGELLPRGHARGTTLLAQPCTLHVKVPAEPTSEVVHQPPMDRAQPIGREHLGMVASGNGAGPRHGPIASTTSSGLDVVHVQDLSAEPDAEPRSKKPRTPVTRDVVSFTTSSCNTTSLVTTNRAGLGAAWSDDELQDLVDRQRFAGTATS